MISRPKFRKFCKWTGLVLCAVLLAVWIGSRWYSFVWLSPTGGICIVLFSQGCSGCGIGDVPIWDDRGCYFGATYGSKLLWGFYHSEFQNSNATRSRAAFVPLWFPLLISCAGTVWVWHVDRRQSRTGMCKQCGYDLSGLTDSTCPECGVNT